MEPITAEKNLEKVLDKMNIVVAGHVDHGKSTLIGRLLADTGSLPEGKLESVKKYCEKNSRPFEYAYLLDALKDEQSQGITIDSARCFFKTPKRHYIIIDAPGHIEFLKNMITGASRAEAAVLIIDAKEGVRENSRRHGYMLSMLGVNQIVVCVNKMDLAGFQEERFNEIVKEYDLFLKEINIRPAGYIPISGRLGDNIANKSKEMNWYKGNTVLEFLDLFEKEKSDEKKPFRMPVQDIYKFTNMGDDRRIIAGKIESGQIQIGDEIIFYPSGKKNKIKTIEVFNAALPKKAVCGESTGFTLDTEIYIQPGEIMCKSSEAPAQKGSLIKTNLFWMGHQSMVKGKQYKLKIGTRSAAVWLHDIVNVLDASDLASVSNKNQIDRHDVAECILQTFKPIAFDLSTEIASTGRFVIVDNYKIAGGGIILESLGLQNEIIKEHIRQREKNWERSSLSIVDREERYKQKPLLIVITGENDIGKQKLARSLEESLFKAGKYAYYLGVSNALSLSSASGNIEQSRASYIRQLGEISHLFTDAGLILITTASDIDDAEYETLKMLNNPSETFVIYVGKEKFLSPLWDMKIEENFNISDAVQSITEKLEAKKVLVDYMI
ncbi:MAG: GTP-binding protein [Spirochaetia bacterium]|nr:GTP-binding protein [Spirochaetia bacterium]